MAQRPQRTVLKQDPWSPAFRHGRPRSPGSIEFCPFRKVMMSLDKEAERLRVYIGEADTLQGRPRYEWIVEAARRHGFGGTTVLRGVMGFGADSLIQTTDALRLSGDLPIVIEIVDSVKMITSFLPELDQLMDEGLVTREKVHVVLYRQSRSKLDRDTPK